MRFFLDFSLYFFIAVFLIIFAINIENMFGLFGGMAFHMARYVSF